MDPADLRAIFSANLRDTLADCEANQVWLARQLDVTEAYVSKLCAGSVMPNWAMLSKIGRVLDVDPRELLYDSSEF